MQITELVTPCEAADLLRVSRSLLYRLIEVSDFPKRIHLSQRRVVFRKDDLQAWVSKRAAANVGGEPT